jgi:hypothetical protein
MAKDDKIIFANLDWLKRQSPAVQAGCVRVKALDSISECGFIPASKPALHGPGGNTIEEAKPRYGWLTLKVAHAYGARVEILPEDQKAYDKYLADLKK